MEFIATIDSISSALPADLDKVVALEIKRSCLVTDAFQILDNYPNIKHVKVAGRQYTSQEVKQMGIGEILGGERTAGLPVFTEETRLRTAAQTTTFEEWATVPIPQAPTGMYEFITGQTGAAPQQPAPEPYPGIYEQLQAAAPTPGHPFDINRAIQQVHEIQREQRRNDQYTQAMQDGMRQYQQDYLGQWRDNVTTARPMTAIELTNQNAIRGTTADMVYHYEPISTLDTYWGDGAVV